MQVYYERRFKEARVRLTPRERKRIISWFNPTGVSKGNRYYRVDKKCFPLCAGRSCDYCPINLVTQEIGCCSEILNRMVPGILDVIDVNSNGYYWKIENNQKARALLKKLGDEIRKFKRNEIKKGE